MASELKHRRRADKSSAPIASDVSTINLKASLRRSTTIGMTILLSTCFLNTSTFMYRNILNLSYVPSNLDGLLDDALRVIIAPQLCILIWLAVLQLRYGALPHDPAVAH